MLKMLAEKTLESKEIEDIKRELKENIVSSLKLTEESKELEAALRIEEDIHIKIAEYNRKLEEHNKRLAEYNRKLEEHSKSLDENTGELKKLEQKIERDFYEAGSLICEIASDLEKIAKQDENSLEEAKKYLEASALIIAFIDDFDSDIIPASNHQPFKDYSDFLKGCGFYCLALYYFKHCVKHLENISINVFEGNEKDFLLCYEVIGQACDNLEKAVEARFTLLVPSFHKYFKELIDSLVVLLNDLFSFVINHQEDAEKKKVLSETQANLLGRAGLIFYKLSKFDQEVEEKIKEKKRNISWEEEEKFINLLISTVEESMESESSQEEIEAFENAMKRLNRE